MDLHFIVCVTLSIIVGALPTALAMYLSRGQDGEWF